MARFVRTRDMRVWHIERTPAALNASYTWCGEAVRGIISTTPPTEGRPLCDECVRAVKHQHALNGWSAPVRLRPKR